MRDVEEMDKRQLPMATVIGLIITGIGVVVLLVGMFVLLTGDAGDVRTSTLAALEEVSESQEEYRSEINGEIEILKGEIDFLKEAMEKLMNAYEVTQ